ncbi:MAG: hypothetical protein H0V03_11865 [Thermoleophilaceae bacterium]|nr:hypothetical protein [Thermoleophilaceae bacterium]
MSEPPSRADAMNTSQLRERRNRLAEEFAELQWDLGGMAYEMAIRDHFRLDVIVRAAARVQEADAELAEVERLLRLEDAAAAGTCPNCGSLHSRGAVFCWQCGEGLMEVRPAAVSVPPSEG